MFEIGEIYQFITGVGDDWSSENCEVVQVELPLVKVKSRQGVVIINTASPTFQRANHVDYEAMARRTEANL